MRYKKSLAIVFSTALSAGALAADPDPDPVPVPRSMAVMGDSITAGAIADYTVESWKNPFQVLQLLDKILDMSVGKNLQAIERKDLSWAADHAKLMDELLVEEFEPAKLKYNNFAATGYSTKQMLQYQVPQMYEWSKRKLRQPVPDFVAMFIGANDICAQNIEDMTSVELFKDRVQGIVSELLTKGKNNKVLLTELPNIESLWGLAKDHKLSKFKQVRTCSDVWTHLRCDTLLVLDSEAERKIVRQRVLDFNQVYSDVVRDARKKFGDRVRLAGGFYEAALTMEHLSADCFHPSRSGQKDIAKRIWSAAWWSQEP